MRRNNRPPIMHYVLKPVVQAAIRGLFRIHIEGFERLPAEPYIMVSNHLGWIDPILFITFWPASPRLVFIGNAKTTVERPVLRVLLRLVGNPIVPFSKLNRESRFRGIQGMIREARAGNNIGFFPEGRTGVEGKMCPFHLGAFVVARKLNRPIVPVGISGFKELYWRKPLHLRIGDPILPREGETTEDLATRTHAAVRALIPPCLERPGRRHLKWLANLLGVERHPFKFDGQKAVYSAGDPDGYDVPENVDEFQEPAKVHPPGKRINCC